MLAQRKETQLVKYFEGRIQSVFADVELYVPCVFLVEGQAQMVARLFLVGDVSLNLRSIVDWEEGQIPLVVLKQERTVDWESHVGFLDNWILRQ